MATHGTLRRFARQGVRDVFYVALTAFGFGYRLWKPSAPPRDVESVERILVIRLDLLGDVLWSMPVVEALRRRYPRAHIVMLTLPYTAPLARLYPSVDDVVAVDTNRIRTRSGLADPRTWSGYWRAVRLLRSRDFDLCISLHGRMGSLWAVLAGAKWSVGYEGEAYPYLLSELVAGGRFQERTHEVDYGRRLALYVGASSMPERVAPTATAAARSAVDALLERDGIGVGERLVVIHAGSLNGSAKRWPAASWGRFAREVQTRTGARIVLVGGPQDAPIAREVERFASSAVRSLVGQTRLEELVALVARADLVASGDSGPLHLAVALGRPALGVYGPTDPALHGPYRPTAPTRVHRKDLPCSPCYTLAASAECPLGNPICMQLVTVPEMVKSAVELMGDV